MNPEGLTDIPALVGEMSREGVDRLLTMAAAEEMEIVLGPRSGLVMMTCRDVFDCEFHLGEVLVSEAEVMCDGVRGYGMTPGSDLRRALARAVTEAILAGANADLQAQLRRLAADEAQCLAARRWEEDALIARTRVRFDLMAGS